jgi:Transposase domain (DUF772)
MNCAAVGQLDMSRPISLNNGNAFSFSSDFRMVSALGSGRLADSLALRRFVGMALDEYPPDQSTISRPRRRIDLDTHREVFGWVLGVLADRGLLKRRADRD